MWGGGKGVAEFAWRAKKMFLAWAADLTGGCVLNKHSIVDMSTCFWSEKQQSV